MTETPIDSLDPVALTARVRAGDRAAFRVIVEAYKGPLYRLAMGYTRNHHDAEDAVQEAFLRAYRALPEYRGDARLSSWLYRITLNVCVDAARRKQTAAATLVDTSGDVEGISERPCSDPARRVESRAVGRAIAAAVARLTPLERSVFNLRHHGGLAIKEVAEVLDRREGTVKGMLFRALRKLRSDLASHRPHGRLKRTG